MSLKQQNESLLKFLYQIPVAVLQIDNAGVIEMINPAAAQMLLPLSAGKALENLFTLLEAWYPGLEETLRENPDPGVVLQAGHIKIENPVAMVLSLTLTRMDKSGGIAVINDITEAERLRLALSEAREVAAQAKGKSEAAAAVLHDIGNAATSAGTASALLFAEEKWDEIRIIQRVKDLLASHADGISTVVGSGKGPALVQILEQLSQSLEKRSSRISERARSITGGISHIEDILNIQRSYAGLGSVKESGQIDFNQAVDESISLQRASLEKRDIEINVDFHNSPLIVKADRTRLTQLIVNLLRNTAEAFDRKGPSSEPNRLRIQTTQENGEAKLQLEDNACGFDPAITETLFESGTSGKEHKSGIGLGHCRKIAETHGGTLVLQSEGPGQGASVLLSIPLHPTPEA
jgi:signal transduction histidine kinase